MKSMLGYTLALTTLILTACDQKLRFGELGSNQKAEAIIPIEDIPSVPVYKKTSGTCSADSSTSVVSCLKCEVPPLPPVEPPMSLKARQLLQIMSTACGVYNKSYGSSYVAPDAATHLAKLNRCSPSLYKDSAPTAQQADLISRLISQDASLLNKMFGGLWYQPPYSDYFETYFGLEVGEAAQVFCMQSSSNVSGGLYPASYWQDSQDFNYKLPAEYVAANGYRDGLKACIPESQSNPWAPSGPAPTQKTCTFETLTGEAGAEITTQVSAWLAQGYTVGADVKNQGLCMSISKIDQINMSQGEISVGAYKCQ